MDLRLPVHLEDPRSSVEGFAATALAPEAVARAQSPEYPWDVAERLGEQGLLGLSIPEEKGGQGAGLLAAVTAVQAIATGCPRRADAVQVGNLGAVRTFAEYASEEQRERYLPDLLAGRSLLALGMSEPEAGSAVTELRTTATRCDLRDGRDRGRHP